jgi:catalase
MKVSATLFTTAAALIDLLLALKISGQDPDFHRKDLEEAIMNGAYPRWTFEIQVIPEGDKDKFDFE